MKNKGFTIVELLVTISLVAIISVAAGVGINEMFSRQRERNYDEYIRTITNAACTYAEVNNIWSNTSVSINTLLNEGYLSKKLKNPIDNTLITAIGSQEVAINIVNYERKCFMP